LEKNISTKVATASKTVNMENIKLPDFTKPRTFLFKLKKRNLGSRFSKSKIRPH
jgi:hypothetical protein